MSDGRPIHLRKRPAINYLSFPLDSPQVLQERLVHYLLSELACFSELLGRPISSAGISLGAALNARTGLVLNSGPLWGPNSSEFDLLAVLRGQNGTVSWQLFNDITANLLFYATMPQLEQYSKLSLITVSTGIGMRTFEKNGTRIPTDTEHGIQGEIGHIAIKFELFGNLLELDCDCGGRNHLNAFCSGRGIGRVLERVANNIPRRNGPPWFEEIRRASSEEARKKIFTAAVAAGDKLAGEVLDCLTKPLAEALIFMFTIDPTIEQVLFIGGVVRSLGARYLESVLQNACRMGLYQVSNRDSSYFHRRVVLGSAGDDAGLMGAGMFTDN